MDIDLIGILSSLWQVLAVGLLFGAGLPALFAVGIRCLGRVPEGAAAGTEATPTGGSRALAVVCFGLCGIVAAFGIVVIVFGQQIFGTGH